jgi:hypothetical protein
VAGAAAYAQTAFGRTALRRSLAEKKFEEFCQLFLFLRVRTHHTKFHFIFEQ